MGDTIHLSDEAIALLKQHGLWRDVKTCPRCAELEAKVREVGEHSVTVEGNYQLILEHKNKLLDAAEAVVRDMLSTITQSPKRSIGGHNNTYVCQIGVEHVQRWREALAQQGKEAGDGV